MKGIDVPQSEIEKVRAFVKQIDRSGAEVPDDTPIGPRLMGTTYIDFLRLIAWWGCCTRENVQKHHAECVDCKCTCTPNQMEAAAVVARAQRNFHCVRCQAELERASGSLMNGALLRVRHTCGIGGIGGPDGVRR